MRSIIIILIDRFRKLKTNNISNLYKEMKIKGESTCSVA